MRKSIIHCALVAVVTMGAWPETSSPAGPPDPSAGNASQSPSVPFTFAQRGEEPAAAQVEVAELEAELESLRAERDAAIAKLAKLGEESTRHTQELQQQLHETMDQANEAVQRREKENAVLMHKLADRESLSSARQQKYEKKIADLSEQHDRAESILNAMLGDLPTARPAAMRRWLVRLVTRHDLPSSYLVRLLNDRDGRVRKAAASSLREHYPLVAQDAGLAPWEAPPWPADDRTMTAGEKNTRQALNRNGGPLEFIECPFLQVIEFLRDYFDINLTLDTPSLEKAGVDFDSPTDLNVEVATLRSTLRLVLEQFDPSLTYTVRGDVLLITTVESSKDVEVVTYDVAELLGKGQTADVLAVKLQRIFGTSDEKAPAPCRLSIEGHGRKLIVGGPEWQQHRVARLLTSLKPKSS